MADQLDVTGITETTGVTSARHTDGPTTEDGPVQTQPDPEQIVTLLPEAEDQSDQSSGAELGQTEPQNGHVNANAVRSESRGFSLHEYLLQRCSCVQQRRTDSRPRSAVITSSLSSITESPVILTPDALSELQPVVWDLTPSLTSDLLVSTDRLSVESVSECLTATLPPQSTDHLIESAHSPDHVTLSDLVTRSSGDQVDRELISASTGLESDISTPTVSISTADDSLLTSASAPVDEAASVTLTPAEAAHPSGGSVQSAEAKSKELVEDEGSANMEQPSSEIFGDALNSSEAPAHGSSQKESVFMRLNNRIKALEMNMSLSGRYLEQLSQR